MLYANTSFLLCAESTVTKPVLLPGSEHLLFRQAYSFIAVQLRKGGTGVRFHIYLRVLEISNYFAETGATVRQAAQEFSISKSTVHKDMAERLPRINPQLAQKVRAILDQNKADRHLRGGAATRRKYLRI